MDLARIRYDDVETDMAKSDLYEFYGARVSMDLGLVSCSRKWFKL